MKTEKKGIVEELVSEVKGVNPLVFTDYKGIKANNLAQLRRQLTAIDGKFRVVKNRLFKRALDDIGLKELPFQIKGFLAVAYGGRDTVSVIKLLTEFVKNNPDTIKIKGGFIDNVILPTNRIEEIAKLPSREELLGRLIAQIGAPISRLAMVLKGNLQALVCVLDGVAKKKMPEGSSSSEAEGRSLL